MVSVPVRDALLGLFDTEYVTVPDPVPLVPAVTVIQSVVLRAVQEQPLCVVTSTRPFPPWTGTMLMMVGEMA